jgi:hypothetical protein
MILLTYFAGFTSYLLWCVVGDKGFQNAYVICKLFNGVWVFTFGSPRVELIIAKAIGEN